MRKKVVGEEEADGDTPAKGLERGDSRARGSRRGARFTYTC